MSGAQSTASPPGLPYLPVEITKQIWDMVFDFTFQLPQVYRFSLVNYDFDRSRDLACVLRGNKGELAAATRAVRSLLRICRDVRSRALEQVPEQLVFEGGLLWFNNEKDIVCVKVSGHFYSGTMPSPFLYRPSMSPIPPPSWGHVKNLGLDITSCCLASLTPAQRHAEYYRLSQHLGSFLICTSPWFRGGHIRLLNFAKLASDQVTRCSLSDAQFVWRFGEQDPYAGARCSVAALSHARATVAATRMSAWNWSQAFISSGQVVALAGALSMAPQDVVRNIRRQQARLDKLQVDVLVRTMASPQSFFQALPPLPMDPLPSSQ